ncbi:MAG: DinB family protein [Candidatus Nanopelagicales bacterium]
MAGSFETKLGDERTQLEAFVHDQREQIALLLDGIDDEMARRRLVPSLTTLGGLVKHCAFVERVWFQVGLLGRTRAEVGLPEEIDDSFVLTDDDTVESLVADYRLAWAESLAAAAAYGLDDLVEHNRRSPMTLRWVHLHLVRELARHAGHGDILREQILAADGDGPVLIA